MLPAIASNTCVNEVRASDRLYTASSVLTLPSRRSTARASTGCCQRGAHHAAPRDDARAGAGSRGRGAALSPFLAGEDIGWKLG